MRQWTGLAVIQLGCRMFGANPLPEPCWLDVQWVLGNKFQWNSNKKRNFHSWNRPWKCRLRNGGHFFQGKMCYTHFFTSFDLSTQGAHHSHFTRQRNQIRPNSTRTRYADNTLRNYLPDLINNTPPNILQKMTTHSIHGFSSNIKKFYLKSYEVECSIPNCYVCNRWCINWYEPLNVPISVM